jgi:hypothetical protein
MRQSALEQSAHVSRAERHFKVGCALHDAGDEWAAVCYFYAAYHLVKAAMLVDPIFQDPAKCAAKHADLNMEDRFTDRHQVRRSGGSGRGWGVNDLVLLLYRSIAGDYDRLHQASVSVRYRQGLPADALPALRASVDNIFAAFADGSISA